MIPITFGGGKERQTKPTASIYQNHPAINKRANMLPGLRSLTIGQISLWLRKTFHSADPIFGGHSKTAFPSSIRSQARDVKADLPIKKRVPKK
jgi:hypothetical protein